MNNFDIEYDRRIPPEIMSAALKLDIFFKEQGIKEWCLGNVCSRNYYEKLNNIKRIIQDKEVIKDWRSNTA